MGKNGREGGRGGEVQEGREVGKGWKREGWWEGGERDRGGREPGRKGKGREEGIGRGAEDLWRQAPCCILLRECDISS